MKTGNRTGAHLVRLRDQTHFPLTERLTTIGSSKRSIVRIDDTAVAPHSAYVLFNQGGYFIYPVADKMTVYCNGKPLHEQHELMHQSVIKIGNDSFLFENNIAFETLSDMHSTLRKLFNTLSSFFSNVNSDSQVEMLIGIAQALRCDGARLVTENAETNRFTTIARFPLSSSLDRFSERALEWAKKDRRTVLMSASQWQDTLRENGSLEINNVGSVLCMPILSETIISGYLYLDRLVTSEPFSQTDWEICDALSPVFGDMLSLYNKTIEQKKIIDNLIEQQTPGEKQLIYSCDKMRNVLEKTIQFSATDTTILLNGETGTGKEVVARLVHKHSKRKGKPFNAINCGAIPENLIESELFGHEKGAFTGASSRKPGLFESSCGGTVFLDEIGELPFGLQVKLLRVLQESEVLPVGATSVVKIDTRVIAATNKNLIDEVERGTFRKDLYYRLNILRVELPPLRERGHDIILLADFFSKQFAIRFNFPQKEMTLAARSCLLKHSWPGNIRELENVMQKAVIIAKGSMIDIRDIEIENIEKQQPKETSGICTLRETREDAEKKAIINALDYCNGNVTMASNLLAVDRKWLTKLIRAYSIDRIKINETEQ